MRTIESTFAATILFLEIMTIMLMLSVAEGIGDIRDHAFQHAQDFYLGAAVTTSSEYEHLTNDSFTGVVVRGETRDYPALTVRNRDGVERRIATEFLEPMR